MLKLFFALNLFALLASAATPICARHYKEVQGSDPCQKFPENYDYVAKLDDGSPVCTREYLDLYCGESDKFLYVKTLKKRSICIMNYNNPEVADLCVKTPLFYSYVREAP